MAKMKVVEPMYEANSGAEHKEHQSINTRVSHYLRLYATGKIKEFPTNGLLENRELPEDLRNDILNRNLPLPEMGTDPVEIMDYLAKNKQRYHDLIKDYNLAITDNERYQAALKVLDDNNSTPEQLLEASKVIEAIERKARARSL